MRELVVLDGSIGTGGGQILRTSLALSAILGVPFKINNIRRRRPRPGLMPQHLAGVRAVARLTGARVDGDRLGATELMFIPEGIKADNLVIDVAAEKGSAGAVTLVVQTILPVMLFAPQPVEATIRGGTHVPFSPVFEFLQAVLLPFIRRIGYRAEAEIKKAGFYPAGGGEITVRTLPVRQEALNPVNITGAGKLLRLRARAAVSRLPLSIAERQVKRLKQLLTEKGYRMEGEAIENDAPAPGTYLFLHAEYENAPAGFSGLGKRGKPAETIAVEVFEQFQRHHQTGAAIEPHLSDQILIFLALTGKDFSFTTSDRTEHLQTNIQTITRFIPELEIKTATSPNNITLVEGRYRQI